MIPCRQVLQRWSHVIGHIDSLKYIWIASLSMALVQICATCLLRVSDNDVSNDAFSLTFVT